LEAHCRSKVARINPGQAAFPGQHLLNLLLFLIGLEVGSYSLLIRHIPIFILFIGLGAYIGRDL